MKIIISLIFCSALFFANESNAAFNDAVKNYQNGDYEEAYAEFKSLSEIGNKDAQFNLGMMYLDGLGTKKDMHKAFAWLKLSDEHKESSETQIIIEQLVESFSEEQSALSEGVYSEIYKTYSNSIIAKDLKPLFEKNQAEEFLAIPLKTSPAIYPIVASRKGIEGFTKVQFNLDRSGVPHNIKILGSHPRGIFDRSSILAIRNWKFKLNQENDQNYYTYKLIYQFNKSPNYKVKVSSEVINKLSELKEQAESGNAASQYLYARHASYLDEKVNPTEWYYQSAIQGIANSQYELGKNLLNGVGCEADKKKGLNWLTRSASANLGRAQLALYEYYKETQIENHENKRHFWIKKALESNDKTIALDLAKYMSAEDIFQPSEIIKLLKSINEEEILDVVTYYELLAMNYSKQGLTKEAYANQREANKIMKKFGKLPKKMRDSLTRYKELSKKS
ncbi:TonB family protein [Kangiella sp. HZ709]|uniref:TonB family protein n=1 Tax=Kangiella sp. HZ709 TaxID=2666328 RepID=UPI0012B006FF|nr:TonB family protein [Kangiella sp. HZ709]MRX27014.1 TonB family protein [Kangiella sp. HZ709]